MKTIVVLSHPHLDRSRLNRALFEAAKGVAGVSVRHLEAIYGTDTSKFDVKKEQELLANAGRIVFLFPTFCFNVPPMLKGYMDEVFTQGFAYGEGSKLAGKELQLAVSLGGNVSDYSKHGDVKFTLNEVFTPLQCMADFCGLAFNRIFASGGIELSISDEEIAAHAQRFVKLLNNELEEQDYQI